MDHAASAQHTVLRHVYDAVNTHVWIAVSVSVRVASIRTRRDLERSVHPRLQILSVPPFAHVSRRHLRTDTDPPTDPLVDGNQRMVRWILSDTVPMGKWLERCATLL